MDKLVTVAILTILRFLVSGSISDSSLEMTIVSSWNKIYGKKIFKSRTSQNKFSILKIGPISRVSAFSSKLSSQTIIKDQKKLFTEIVFLFLIQGNRQGLKFFKNPHGIFFKLENKFIEFFHLFFKWHFWKKYTYYKRNLNLSSTICSASKMTGSLAFSFSKWF